MPFAHCEFNSPVFSKISTGFQRTQRRLFRRRLKISTFLIREAVELVELLAARTHGTVPRSTKGFRLGVDPVKSFIYVLFVEHSLITLGGNSFVPRAGRWSLACGGWGGWGGQRIMCRTSARGLPTGWQMLHATDLLLACPRAPSQHASVSGANNSRVRRNARRIT